MRLLLIAGAFWASAIPAAGAGVWPEECELDQARPAMRAQAETVSPAAAGGSAPTVGEQDKDSAPARPAQRRRYGKPIPDAELIGPTRLL